jgi:2-polyprenyl-6-methoxyphenol hydroxylase-like FAD-dependent oxidoreductase
MHISEAGYVGLCRLPGEEVNVCGLFRRCGTEPALPALLPEIFSQSGGALLRSRLIAADWNEETFCAVGGVPFRQFIRPEARECRLGDAWAMMPPMTGNGMSMAIESAELALAPLCQYAEGSCTWKQTTRAVWERSRSAFAARLRHADWLHAAIFRPWIRDCLLPRLDRWGWLWRMFFRATR